MRKKFHIVWLLVAAFWAVNPIDVVAQQRNAPAFEHVHSLAMDSGGQTLFLGAHTGLFRSDDGGRSWTKVPLSTKHSHVDVMAVTPDPREAKTIYVGTHEAGCLKAPMAARLGSRRIMAWEEWMFTASPSIQMLRRNYTRQ